MDLYYDGTKWASVIADENLTATHIRFHIPVNANQWYFYSFPFRVYLNKVTAPGSYVFRRYDGAARALSGATGWASLPFNTEYLEPGVGYIFQCNTKGTLVIEVEAPNFNWGGVNKTNTLTAHNPGQGISDQHASWNFVGNPMTNYYDIDDMGYSSPLTIWNGSSYVAYRPGDDNYQLSPFEAFFVQKPVSGNDPTYTKGNRMSYNAAQTAHSNKATSRRMEQGPRDRYLLNLVLSNGTDEDKTRVVFNEKTSKDYEMECDAAKFMSSEQVPQLFSVDAQTRFAINERPQGEVNLGFTAPKAGTYTLRAERMDMPVVVKDLVMGTTHELKNGEYTFDTEAGTFESRFVLITLRYMAPEQAQTAEPDVRNDIYSLGIIISQMQLGRGYRKIAERCLKPIHQRYQSVAELQADLRKAGNRKAATKKLALTLLILALLALAVVQTWRLQHAPEPVLIQPDLDSMRQQMSLQEQMSQERERQMNNSLGLLSDSLHRMASDNEQLQNQLHRVDDAKKTALHELRKQMKASALDRHVDTLSRWDYR